MNRSQILVTFFTFVSANVLVMLINYGFHIVTANQLSAPSYGLMSALMAVFAVVAYISIGLQTKCADLAAKSPASQNYNLSHTIVRYWLKKSVFISIAIGLIMLVFSASIAHQLHAHQAHIWLLIAAIMTVLPLSCLRGFLLGKENYFGLSLNMVAESLVKFIAVYFVLNAGYDLGAVVATILGGQLVSIVLALIAIRHAGQNKANSNLRGAPLPAWLMSVYFACFAIWSTLDVVVVQIFQPEVAGAYSVATRIGQVVLFGLTTITTFLYPKFSNRSTDARSFRMLFLPAVLVLFMAGSIVALILFELRAIVVLDVFGLQYQDAMIWVGYLCSSALGLGLAHLAMHFMIAKANRQIVLVYLLFTLFYCIGVLLSAMHSIQSLLLLMVAATWVLFGCIFVYAFRTMKI